jgi:hypothetical protein
MSEDSGKVYCILQHHLDEENSRILGIFTSPYSLIQAMEYLKSAHDDSEQFDCQAYILEADKIYDGNDYPVEAWAEDNKLIHLEGTGSGAIIVDERGNVYERDKTVRQADGRLILGRLRKVDGRKQA